MITPSGFVIGHPIKEYPFAEAMSFNDAGFSYLFCQFCNKGTRKYGHKGTPVERHTKDCRWVQAWYDQLDLDVVT